MMAEIIANRMIINLFRSSILPLIILIISSPVMAVSIQSDHGLNPENFSMKGFGRIEKLERIGNKNVFEDDTPSSLGFNVDGKFELDWAYEDFSIDTISYGKYRSQYRNSDSDMEHDAEVREWILGYESENWQYRLGKQQVAWGKGDYFRIIDVINPLNLTESLIPYLDDYSLGRIPREMLVVEHFQDDVEYQFITAFETQRTEFAEVGTDFSVEGLPSNSIKADSDNIDLALRIRFFIDSTDIDIYAFSGYNPNPLYSIEENDSQIYTQEHLEKRNVAAVSFARSISFGVLRSDIAYYLDEAIQSGSTFENVSKLETLIGIDIQEDEWSYNLQATVSQIFGQSDRFDAQDTIKSASAFIQKEWSRQRLMSSLVWLYNDLNHSSNMLKYNVRYDWRSDSQFEVGLIVFDGPMGSLYGMYNDQDRVYLNFKQSF
jgi:hypothetical protein